MSKLIVGLRARGSIDIDAPVGEYVGPIAGAIKRLGGEVQIGTWPAQWSQVKMLGECRLDDPEKKLTLDDPIRDDEVVFVATGLTPGEPLNGVRHFRGGARIHTVVRPNEPRVVRFVDTIHTLGPEAGRKGFRL